MARLNNRPSTVAASSRANTAAPPSSNASDQENYDPLRERDPRRDKRPVMEDPPGRESLPTPSSEEAAPSSTGQKRKRGSAATQDLDDGDEENGEDEEENEEEEAADPEFEKFNRYYDPNQDLKKRQEVKRKSRKLDREIVENRDQIIRDPELIARHTRSANHLYKNVKQTADATVDAHIMVNLADALHKSTAQLIHGDASTGIDVNEFLSKCINYMRNGGHVDSDTPTATQRRRRTQSRNAAEDDNDDDDNMQPLDWELLGANACHPYNSRPACPSFLLGPLSVEKKVRAQTQRRARQIKDNSREARPEALTREAGAAEDQNALSAICDRIHRHLTNHIRKAEAAVEKMHDRGMEIDQEAFCKKYKITGDGGPSLFEYCINPNSFGETIENLFYVSFLIKEGHVGIMIGEDDAMPTLILKKPHGQDDEERAAAPAGKKEAKKHQAVFSIDFEIWQQLIEAFNITEPMIPSREEDAASLTATRFSA